MWVKNINVVNVENRGLDDRLIEGTYNIVKRVTIEVDVVMLGRHDGMENPMDRVHANMDSQIWFLKDPVVKAVYTNNLGRAEHEPPLPN